MFSNSTKQNHSSAGSDLLNIRAHLCRLACFGANLTDAYSCFVFLPPSFLDDSVSRDRDQTTLLLAGQHSLCNDLIENCQIAVGSGLIGWVARHAQAIHVSPFDHDSRTLGMYRDDRELKSFMGIPIHLRRDGNSEHVATGVIACDSKKSYAFSKLQGKLLANLAHELAVTLELIYCQKDARGSNSWNEFEPAAQNLVDSIGAGSLDVLRVVPANFSELERSLGTARAAELIQQFIRLVQQALPPEAPLCLLPNGDLVLLLDNMITGFYENKLIKLAEHIKVSQHSLKLYFARQALQTKKLPAISIEQAVALTSGHTPSSAPSIPSLNPSTNQLEVPYEHRRA